MNAASPTRHWLRRVPVAVLVAVLLLGALVPSGSAQSPSPLTLQPETGRVGIGTASPEDRLHVAGPPATGLVLDNGVVIRQKNAAGVVGSLLTHWTDNNVYVDNADGSIMLRTGAGYLIRAVVGASGNVGIGTASPTTRFQVSGGRATFRANNEPYAVAVAYSDSESATDTFFLGVTTNGGTGGTGMFKISNASGAPRLAVLNNGDVAAAGAVYGTAKYFQIPHPLDPAKLLTHASLEGPEAGVYYRGEAQLAKGEAEIVLPAYFEALTRKEGRTVQLTPVQGWSPLYVVQGIQSGRFTVRTTAQGDPAQRFYWEVKAVRTDIGPVVVERDTLTTPTAMPPQ